MSDSGPGGPLFLRDEPSLESAPPGGALPNLVVIGAMKCGTTALHRYLDHHPDIAMSEPKELNFFFGPADGHQPGGWTIGNWQRGLPWYERHFRSEAPVRGESSPGYTSPSHPETAERMAAVIPSARLLYLVRDPVARAVSQYRHHRADGTEHRPLQEALLDPRSQYVSRGCYHDRLRPFLTHFPREQLAIVPQEALLTARRATLRSLFRFLGVDEEFWSDQFHHRWHTGREQQPELDRRTTERLTEAFRDDAERLRALAEADFPGWSV